MIIVKKGIINHMIELKKKLCLRSIISFLTCEHCGERDYATFKSISIFQFYETHSYTWAGENNEKNLDDSRWDH